MPIDEIGGLPKPTITNYAKKVATPTIAAPKTGPAQPPPPSQAERGLGAGLVRAALSQRLPGVDLVRVAFLARAFRGLPACLPYRPRHNGYSTQGLFSKCLPSALSSSGTIGLRYLTPRKSSRT